MASFSIATTENWTSKDGQKQEQTEWHRIVLWGKTAETLQPYLTKGKQIYVEGRLQTRQWEKDGQKHYTTEVKADKVVLLGGGGGGGERGDRGDSGWLQRADGPAGRRRSPTTTFRSNEPDGRFSPAILDSSPDRLRSTAYVPCRP